MNYHSSCKVFLEILGHFGYIGTWVSSPKHHFCFLHSPLCKSMLCLLVLVTAGKTLKSNSSLTTVVERDTWRIVFFLDKLFFLSKSHMSGKKPLSSTSSFSRMYSSKNHTELPQQVSPPPKSGNKSLAFREMWHRTLLMYPPYSKTPTKGKVSKNPC